ncbi:MAG: prolyl oligopeptidase family serine peptidase [Pseudomonadota bacterium]
MQQHGPTARTKAIAALLAVVTPFALCSRLEAAAVDLGAYALEDFARLPNVGQIRLSRGGTHLSAVYASEAGVPTLLIQNLDDDSYEPYAASTGDWRFNWTNWISDHQLLVSVTLPTRLGGTPVSVTRLFVIDARERKGWLMFTKQRSPGFIQIQDRFLGTVAGKPDHILIQGNPERADAPAVKLVKLSAMRLPNRHYQRPAARIYSWEADKLGNVRYGFGIRRNDEEAIARLKDADGTWHNHSGLLERACEVLELPTHDLNEAWVQCPTDTGFGDVRAFDVRTGEFGEQIAGHPHSDVSNIKLNARGDAIDVVYYESDEVENDYRNPTLAALKALADKNFEDTYNFVAHWSDDYSKAIIGSTSDDAPTHYYLYNGAKKRLDYFTSRYPKMMERAPGRMFGVEFTARDGLVIPGYVTLPVDLTLKTAKGLPFIVHPHGGPHARDYFSYDWMTQMLTAAGYGVLQLNFRGSTGYGLEFKNAGKKQWGQAMQDDITDGTRWLIDQGLADASRICIFGSSYGGYAALMGVVKEPEMYACAASLNGVSDLREIVRDAGDYIGGEYGVRHIGRLWRDRSMLRTNSPRERVDEIRTPVMLAHGEKDRVVRVSQSRRMAKAMKNGALWRYLELPDGNHHLSLQANRMLFARTLLEFLTEHMAQTPTAEAAATTVSRPQDAAG